MDRSKILSFVKELSRHSDIYGDFSSSPILLLTKLRNQVKETHKINGTFFVNFRVFFLDVPNDSVLERLTLRNTDPITGERYHMLYNPPQSQEVKERLQQHPSDTEDAVRERLSQYHTYVEEIADYYTDGQRVNADQDPHTVFECIESMLVNPLPKHFP